MEKSNLKQLTDEELKVEATKRKKSYQAGAFFVGIMLGITIYSTVKNGFGFFIVLPFLVAGLFAMTKVDYTEVKKVIDYRALNN